jgi:hypothetical protein
MFFMETIRIISGLKKHMNNDKLYYYKDLVINSKSNRRVKIRSLDEYYNMFKIKNNVLKEIKENLVE